MPPAHTHYYSAHLETLHWQLLAHPLVRRYLSGNNIRFDGVDLAPTSEFELPGAGTLSTAEFAQLFSVFDGSRVHAQGEKTPTRDDAPPGLHLTIVNPHLIQNQHKNRFVLFQTPSNVVDLFIANIHIDHFFLHGERAPPTLGTLAFALCAITAHLAGLGRIQLVAAGGQDAPRHMLGYKIWPKFGFDAPVEPQEVAGTASLVGCSTVQEVIARDEAWWAENGSQRMMYFDLSPNSQSWQKLLPYVGDKLYIVNAP